MHTRLLALAAALALTAATPLPAQPGPGDAAAPAPAQQRQYQPSRADIAYAYLNFEAALAAASPTGRELARITRGFDAATASFFGGGFAQTVRQLNALTESMLPPAPDAAAARARRTALSLRAAIDPPVFTKASDQTPRLRLDPLYEPPDPADAADERDAAPPLRIRVHRAGDAAAAAVIPVPTTAAPATFPPPPHLADLPAGAYEIRISADDGSGHLTARWFVVEEPLTDLRARAEERIDAIESRAPDPALAPAAAILRARTDLLSDRPSPANSAEFIADQSALAESIPRELAALESGENPYRDHPGDLWRTFPYADIAVPLRVYNPPRPPPAAAGKPPAPRPLVIALHGAGGDENMFMDAYGLGVLKRLADEHGFIAASPRNSPFAADPAYFDALLAALAADYPIDPARVYVLGHSMGAGVTGAWTRTRGGRIAAAACIAGFPPARTPPEHGERTAPTLVVAAEFDAIIPTSRVRPAAEAAQAAGLPIEFRLISNEAHTTVVGATLPEVVRWLMGHRLDGAAQPP